MSRKENKKIQPLEAEEVIKTICLNCRKNEYCVDNNSKKLCYKLNVVKLLLLNKVTIDRLVIIGEN